MRVQVYRTTNVNMNGLQCLPQCAFERATSTRATGGREVSNTTTIGFGSTVAIVVGPAVPAAAPCIIPLHIVRVDEGEEAGGEGLGVRYEGGQLAVAGLVGRHVEHARGGGAAGQRGGQQVARRAAHRVPQPARLHVRQRAVRRHERVRVRAAHRDLEHLAREHVTRPVEPTCEQFFIQLYYISNLL